MNERIQARQEDARATRLVQRKLASVRMDVHNPVFNIREIVKQMILLEDHLSHAYKICPDCIRKHLLTIEALAEEATCLDTGRIFGNSTEALAKQARTWMEVFLRGCDVRLLADKIRQLRKPLCQLVSDPRGMVNRTASRYEQRSISCSHG